jgi:uncharacterized damage-inducible protein DinB
MTMTRNVREATWPPASADERDSLLAWLAFLRDAVIRKLEGLSEREARWRPDGKLISLIGIANHLTHVEWRWIEGGMRGAQVSRSEEEFTPGDDLTVDAAIAAYRERAAATETAVRQMSLSDSCAFGYGTDLRWVLCHLVEETARHAGHADAVRELLDGTTGV